MALTRVAFLATAASVTATHVAPAITNFVPVEMIEGPGPMLREWTPVPTMWIKAVVNVTVKIVGAVKPRTGSDKDTAGEPLGPVVSVGGAVVGRIVEMPIRASRPSSASSNVDSDRMTSYSGLLANAPSQVREVSVPTARLYRAANLRR